MIFLKLLERGLKDMAHRDLLKSTAKHFELPENFFRQGTKNGTLKGTYFLIGNRYCFDWDLLEQRLKELCQANTKPELEQAAYGVLRKIQ